MVDFDIRGLRSEEQMRGVDAQPVVAAMTDTDAVIPSPLGSGPHVSSYA